MAHDWPEPCKFPSLDTTSPNKKKKKNERNCLWVWGEFDHVTITDQCRAVNIVTTRGWDLTSQSTAWIKQTRLPTFSF